MTLEERIRYRIGAGGPQHESEEDYEAYIDEKIEHMDNAELLRRISSELEDMIP